MQPERQRRHLMCLNTCGGKERRCRRPLQVTRGGPSSHDRVRVKHAGGATNSPLRDFLCKLHKALGLCPNGHRQSRQNVQGHGTASIQVLQTSAIPENLSAVDSDMAIFVPEAWKSLALVRECPEANKHFAVLFRARATSFLK